MSPHRPIPYRRRNAPVLFKRRMLCNGNAIRDDFRHGANAELKILANRIRMAHLRPPWRAVECPERGGRLIR